MPTDDPTPEEQKQSSESAVVIGENTLENALAGALDKSIQYKELIKRAFSSGNISRERKDAFNRVFSVVNNAGGDIGTIGAQDITIIVSKMEEIGLLRLAAYAYEIGQFAKRRFKNKDRLQQPLYNEEGDTSLIDEKVDLPWLILLGEVVQRLRREPIFFSTITYYFPGLVIFLMDALAATGDYSGTEDDAETARGFANALEKAFGMSEDGRNIFTLAFKMANTSKRINRVLTRSPYFRKNIAPQSPDIFHLRLGAANFYVPPVSIDVNSAFKTGSLTGGAIRQKNTPKFNTGYRETTVRMRLFFPNYEEIWGLKIDEASSINVNEDYEIDFRLGGDNEEKIDKFLSSLRGLVAAFKYSPILPIKNQYLNTVHGISAVALAGMTISTIPNFPFALAVDLELMNFNHLPFLPMIKDFNQAVHWGKYRQYMGKAAGALHKYVNESFLMKLSDSKDGDLSDNADLVAPKPPRIFDPIYDEGRSSDANSPGSEEQNDILRFNIGQEWEDGRNIVFYVPAETQTKVFLPDTSSFRTEQENLFTDFGRNAWESLLGKFGIKLDLNDSAAWGISLPEVTNLSESFAYSKSSSDLIKDSLDLILAGVNTDDGSEKVYQFLAVSFIKQNTSKLDSDQRDWLKDYNGDTTSYPQPNSYTFNKLWRGSEDGISLNQIKRSLKRIAGNPSEFLDWLADGKVNDTIKRTGSKPDEAAIKKDLAAAFNINLYERFFKSGPIQAIMEANRQKEGYIRFNEWEVPMLKVDFNPNALIVNGVTVTLGNSFAKLQLQMQDEPTYQHIGGRDAYINISMRVIGETELARFKKLFDHISGLARLEHATGVIGFLGLKNVITALAGIKYVVPLNYRVSTVPTFPHAYDVELSLVDFDIFQQTREKLTSTQQQELIDEFSTKKNPFLRIKQLWASFNAYPDFPLQVRNEVGEVVGHLDPDFYFRSFEMFDRDVINNLEDQTPRTGDHKFDNPLDMVDPTLIATINQKLIEWLDRYKTIDVRDPRSRGPVNTDLQKLIDDIIDFYRASGITLERFLTIFRNIISNRTAEYGQDIKTRLLTDFMDLGMINSENNPFISPTQSAPFVQGTLSPSSAEMAKSVEAMLSGEYSIKNEEFISFDPDEVDFHKIIHLVPASDPKDIEEERVPAVCTTAIGMHFGYVDKKTGRFYLTINGTNVRRDAQDGSLKLQSNRIEDTQTPDVGSTQTTTGVPGSKAVSEYQKPYYSGDLYAQMERMMVDTQYRDISGRMIRAFPTYMLWLIDEGGYFAGTKLFDNFYGLQSIIDFSVVSSEDILGDTLVIRVSNMYAKLTTPEFTKIFNRNYEPSENATLEDSLTSIIDRTLNISRNVLSHMKNEYIVDIANIRLKPGVRVHLRAGYGSNPNSLQTIFNGIITNVEQGEIVTITAQSDAIELGAVVNSAHKKGDSGNIDGGVNTGLWMSEPRDLMVRLLSMGASRFREAISRANRGMVFSENRFGIRHFGGILYEPLSKGEQEKVDALRESIASAYQSLGSNDNFIKKSWDATYGFSANTRGNTIGAMGQLWANFSAEVDLEIFKRNIYPGNGTGIAQFLGNDIDDGWLTLSSLTEEDRYNPQIDGHLGNLTDASWNNLVAESQDPTNTGANDALDSLTRDGVLIGNRNGNGFTSAAFSVGGSILQSGVSAIPGSGIIGGAMVGVLRGRGGKNIFRTLGLVSPNTDDDLPGFDEVSFRAQTYMRTVWDLFQTCARLLPNYIVAIRPFEDRSTVFYGKPHWLYTSGVVPVTTGFPGEEKAAELGIITPTTREPSEDLIKILDSINRDSNPLSDYSAFFESFEAGSTFESIAEQMSNSTGVYAPTSRVAGKIMDFYSRAATQQVDKKGGVIAKIPKSKGMAAVGLHLPIIPARGKTSDFLSNQTGRHVQLGNLPPRYRFPFFAASEQLLIDDFPSVEIYSSYKEEGVDALLEAIDDESLDAIPNAVQPYNNLAKLTALELIWFNREDITLQPSGDKIELDLPMNLSRLISEAQDFFPISSTVRMPFPNVRKLEDKSVDYRIYSPSDVNSDFAFEYQSGIYGEITYSEWGAPKTAEDEQFYIAMRWPYKLPQEDLRDEFRSRYELGDLVGTAEDYKNRKVMVYNPTNGRAVICRPAYFLWGEADDVDAVVSPDAAYFLGIITKNSGDGTASIDVNNDLDIKDDRIDKSGFRLVPQNQECYFGFVADDLPLGAVATAAAPISQFTLVGSTGSEIESSDDSFIIGFGSQKKSDSAGLAARIEQQRTDELTPQQMNDPFNWIKPYGAEFEDVIQNFKFGGNPLAVGSTSKTYFEAVIAGEWDVLNRENLSKIREEEQKSSAEELASKRVAFIPVWSPVDQIGVASRGYWDEDFNPDVKVIAGDGRSLKDADQIWDEFRFLYHTFNSVKYIFKEVFNLDPDDNGEFPPYLVTILNGKRPDSDPIKKFGATGDAVDEFSLLLGSDYVSNLPGEAERGGATRSSVKEAIEYARSTWIDAPSSEGGLVEYFNNVIVKQLMAIHKNFLSPEVLSGVVPTQGTEVQVEVDTLSPRKLFYLMVGIFRQRMWEDPYARAWLVLKPDRKRDFLTVGGGSDEDGDWKFKPVDKVFREFINPYNNLAKPSSRQKFIQLLAATRGEGNSNASIIFDAVEGVANFIETNVGPIWTAISDGLAGLLGMFKFNMQQMGYALSEVGNFGKQANILNKALNDSIYYSLGRPGSLLRAVDNPFTREYGEPVVEIREPFQRLHYISSFSHILTNQIQENINGVATMITAVSDGKYPVTVALDKGAPAERQTERTVETGIYYDNMVGEGFFGFLHPLMHPLQTVRGRIKNVQGTPDELSARRIALSHLRESIKDIYGGEIMLVGNADIRPHDLVYLADVYERMYGLFEVEQVVHHFTPELGFITAITPNALVTVNDPARWFVSAWFDSWMNVQAIRNDTRLYVEKIASGSSPLAVGGNVSLEALTDSLSAQISGGLQFTHGSTALMKDIMSNQAAQSLPNSNGPLAEQSSVQQPSGVNGWNLGLATAATIVPFVGQLAWKGWTWVRDNLLDQHGCYVQYLNKNGQPMDAGLSYNQGMVVGKYHSKAMLPGILGVRARTRTPEGNAYIRTDDLLKSLGWREKEINDLVRYTSYENALIHSRVLQLSGLGPEKAGLEQQFKAICKVVRVLDGDTIEVEDCLSSPRVTYKVRFDGINTAELNDISGTFDYSYSAGEYQELSIIDTNTSAGKAKQFTENALKGRLFVVRINPSNTAQVTTYDDAYEAGSKDNIVANYEKDIFEDPRVIGTIFYYTPSESVDRIKVQIEQALRTGLTKQSYSDEYGFRNEPFVLIRTISLEDLKDIVRESFDSTSVFYVKFNLIYQSIDQVMTKELAEELFNFTDPNDLLSEIPMNLRRAYSVLVYMKMLDMVYEKASEWPSVGWDEYYPDGRAVTLNWELVTNNLAKVYVREIQTESDSVQRADELAPIPQRVR